MQPAIDVSNYSGVFSREQAACWRENGYAHVICGTQRPSITRQQLEAAAAAGLTLDAYVYLYWRHNVAAQVKEALATLAGFPVGRLWLDCEDDPAGAGKDAIVGLIAEAVAACGSFPRGIYTGRWWWAPNTGDSRDFAHLPLWHAEYTASPAVLPDFDAFQGYGGWTRPQMWQFQGTTSLCGVTVDLNLRDAAPPPPAPEDMTARDRIELALLRSAQRFDRARAAGRYVFRPAPERQDAVELQRVEGDRGVSFEPPYVIEVD